MSSQQLRFIDWNNLRYALEWIYESAPVQRSTVGRQNFPGLSAWLVRAGSLRIRGGDTEVTAGVGDWVFPPYKNDRREFSEDLKILSLRFRLTWGGENELFRESIPRVVSSHNYTQLEKAASAMLRLAGSALTRYHNNMMLQTVNIGRYIRIQRAFAAWVEEYLDVMLELGAETHLVQITDDRVREAKRILDTYPLEQPLGEAKLAELVGLSVAQLGRLFSKEIGITPAAYFGERRYTRARRLLGMTAMPIKQIGYELGFADPANFTNWFRAKSKHSPRFYREQAQSEK